MESMPARYGIEDIQTAHGSIKISPAQFGFDLPQDYYQNVSGAETLWMCGPGEDAYSLSREAALGLLSSRPELAGELDAIVVTTQPTKPTIVPISVRLQAALGAKETTFCLDLTLSCPGFLQASSVVLDMMSSRRWKKVLLVTVDALSKIVRQDDPPLRLLMSDGAAAMLFSENPKFVFEDFDFFVDGNLTSVLEERDDHLFMDGPKLYEKVIRRIPASVKASLERKHLAPKDVDAFLFHQGSKRLLDRLYQALDLETPRSSYGLENYGNLGASSIPHLLQEFLLDPNPRGRRIFATAFGAGFQWAHALLRQRGE